MHVPTSDGILDHHAFFYALRFILKSRLIRQTDGHHPLRLEFAPTMIHDRNHGSLK